MSDLSIQEKIEASLPQGEGYWAFKGYNGLICSLCQRAKERDKGTVERKHPDNLANKLGEVIWILQE